MANPIIHFEIGCPDKAAAAAFYSSLFGWTVDPQFQISADAAGISGHVNALGHEPHKYTIFYVRVDDIAAAIQRAEELGGKRVVGPLPIPTGRFAWIQDPAGNTVGLLDKPK